MCGKRQQQSETFLVVMLANTAKLAVVSQRPNWQSAIQNDE